MLERSNEVTNFGEVPLTKLVLDVFQLLTIEKLYYAIIIIIEQMSSQKTLASTQGNCIYRRIRCMIHLLYNQPSSVVHKLLALSIHNKVFVGPKMNRCS